ncbi:ubiquitin ligase-binding protein bul1 [Lodderomyces elongisporus]|uniref:ubiquitin ligase-binding protein bul1 n=1 Tax=Lodderomyces elongisporus TaxID=36914 RepID=UPI0029265DC0|nr:ubiquitin ligase-binding protein bul1 [Lodderomyces elongisporus]WLF80198.1 ubiquitin ligase-binding protein bul1 [Lodderomyces elongisporus]
MSNSPRIPRSTDLPPSYETSVSGNTSRVASPSPTRANGNSRSAKNVPYQPSREQQQQINILTNARNNSSATNLVATTSSNTQTEYFDILPSFEMFQSILKRDDQQFQEDLTTVPPRYGDTAHSRSSRPTSPRLHAQSSIDQNLSQVSRRLEDTLQMERDRQQEQMHEHAMVFVDETGLMPVTSTADANSQVHNENLAITSDSYGHSPLDNIDRLQKATKSPFDIQIFVTKDVPRPNQENELETKLKEYTNGDHVNGYVIVTNTSSKPVKFGLFTVSLEGTIKSLERSANPLQQRYRKILMKKILKMYDLCAGYSYGYVPSSAGIEFVPFTEDSYDGCEIGLPDDRILQPHRKYKKFFTFRFPQRLLDNDCPDAIFSHLLPPPSVGVDKTSFYNRGEGIVINKALGYGSLNLRGTPILTKDYSFEDMSVSYAVEAKIIDNVRTKDAVSHDEINDAKRQDYVISKSAQYYLRFIPEQIPFQGISNARKFLEQYQDDQTWMSIREQNNRLEKDIEKKLTGNVSVEEMKMKNLRISESHNSLRDVKTKKRQRPRGRGRGRGTSGGFNVDDNGTNVNKNNSNHNYNNINNNHGNNREGEELGGEDGEEEEGVLDEYEDNNSDSDIDDGSYISTNHPIEIYGKKKKMMMSSLVKIGESTMRVKVPNGVLAYSAPRLLMKYNEVSMERVYNQHTEEVLKHIDAQLTFEGNSRPQIVSIETNIVIWSYSTDYPIPFDIAYDFFYKNHDGTVPSTDPVVTTTKNLQFLKDQVAHYIEFVKDSGIELDKESYIYLKSAQKLRVKKDIIRDYFKPTSISDDKWDVHKLNNIRWTQKLKIPLVVENQRNENLLPTFQSCLTGRLYCLQIAVKFKGASQEANEFAHNVVSVDVPILVG